MANSFLTQTIEEGPRNAVVKLTGVLDTSNLAVTDAVDPANFNMSGTGPVPEQFRIDHIDYSIADQLEVILWWDATADVAILPIAGRGKMSFWNFGGLQNNAGAGKTGKIQISTTGWASGTQVFSIVLELVKQGANL
jgi:hypothetical protein